MRKFVFVFIMAAALFIGISPAAYCAELKGSAAEHSPFLDRETYVSAELFKNRQAEADIIRVGIVYEDEAVDQARFVSDSGAAFILGYYDGERNFIKCGELPYSDLTLISAPLKEGKEPVLQLIDSKSRVQVYSHDPSSEKLALIPAEGFCIFQDEVYTGGFECIYGEKGISVVNYVGLEDYVKGVIPYEMSSYWPMEALKAQAVCARTYAVNKLGEYEELGFDLTDDVYSQVYRGRAYAGERTDSAVDMTAGQFVRYMGEICQVYYFSSDGGATEDGKYVFEKDLPYLIGKYDPFEAAIDFPFASWKVWSYGTDIEHKLREKGYDIGSVASIKPEYSYTGNIIAVEITDTDGKTLRLEGRKAYTALGFNNLRFDVRQYGDTFCFEGSGWGHNCGMSQWGAYAMADVYGFDYQDIIRFYFSGAYAA